MAKAAAASYRWYRDTFGGEYKELDQGAENVPIGAEGLVFHPYLNGELTPYADPTLCGSFVGIRATHTKSHFTRAVLEGVCYSLLDSKKYLDELNIPRKTVATAIGGGTKGVHGGRTERKGAFGRFVLFSELWEISAL